MNNSKRKELSKIKAMLDDAKNKIESIIDEEQDCFDNLTEGLQQTAMGQAMEDAIGNMEDAAGLIEEAIESLDSASI